MAECSVLKACNRTLPGFEEDVAATKWQEDYFFIQAADTQLGMMDNYGDGTIKDQYPNIGWEKEIELCNKSVDIMNSMEPKPKFFIVCGDILDAMPDKWPDIRKRQEADFMKCYSRLDKSIPLVCVCGNHDIGNRPTVETIESYRQSFGDDYFSFWFGGVHFIVLNSQFYEDASMVPELAKAHESWLEGELAKAATHKFVFQHIPWFVAEPDEEKIYFNVEQELRKTMLEKLYAGGVRKIFCGHYHRNAGGWFKDMECVVTTAVGCQIGSDPHGMRIVKVAKDKVTHEYHALDKFPKNVK